MSEAKETITPQVKAEFKRFFEYVFKHKPDYWQELKGHDVLGKARTSAEEYKLFNRLLTEIIQSDVHLKRIIDDQNLNTAKELKYYAYLFLNDTGKAEGITEPKLPEAPEQLAGSYDNLNKLVEIVKDQSKPADLRQQALNRMKELSPFSTLPEKVFDRSVFNAEKGWVEIPEEPWEPPSKPLSFDALVNRLYEHTRRVSREYYESIWIKKDEDRLMEALRYFAGLSPDGLIAESDILDKGNSPYYDKRYEFAIEDILDRCVENKRLEILHNKYINELQEWQKYRKEQDEEFPKRLSDYEQQLETVILPESTLTGMKDFSDDIRFLFLKEKLVSKGEEYVKKLWNDPEEMKQIIMAGDTEDGPQGDPNYPLKLFLYDRLGDIHIITYKENRQLRFRALSRSFQADMTWGDETTEAIDLVGPAIAALAAEEISKGQQKDTNNTEKEDL